MGVFQIVSFRGGLSDYEDKGIAGSFKYGANLDIRREVDSITPTQALVDIGLGYSHPHSPSASMSPSASLSPSSSPSPSISASISPSSSASPSIVVSPSSSPSPSASASPSASLSPSASISPSHSVSPSPSPTSGINSVFQDLIHFFVKCTNGSLYGFGDTGKIYQILADNTVKQVYDLRQPIIGAAEKPSAGGNVYLLFATSTNIHRKQIPGDPSWNDVDAPGTVQGDEWPKTNLTGGVPWHTMVEVGGDIMIANNSFLAMAAYDDSWTNEALDLIPGNVAISLVERVGRAVVGCRRAADPTNGVNGAVDAEVPLLQVGQNGDFYYADFSNTIAVKNLKGGGYVNPGGMTNEVNQVNVFDWDEVALSWINKQAIGNMALMGIFGAQSGWGGLYTAGRRNKNQPFVFNIDHQFDADEIGAVVNWNGLNYMSYRIGTETGVVVEDTQNKAIGDYQGLDFKAPVKMPMYITKWDTAEIYMAPLPAGCAVQFFYRVDKTGNWIQATLSPTTDQTNFTKTGANKAVFSMGVKGEIFEPRVVLIPDGNVAPEVYRIKVTFV